jgi:3-oxoacyl-[acyl-carrier protein] reductase
MQSHYILSLTAAKEAGATIEINGKQVALGVPGAKGATQSQDDYPLIPLRRGGTADEAAAAMLLYVLS